MTPLQIFASIFIIALIAGWVILADACRNALEQLEEENAKDCGGYWN